MHNIKFTQQKETQKNTQTHTYVNTHTHIYKLVLRGGPLGKRDIYCHNTPAFHCGFKHL